MLAVVRRYQKILFLKMIFYKFHLILFCKRQTAITFHKHLRFALTEHNGNQLNNPSFTYQNKTYNAHVP